MAAVTTVSVSVTPEASARIAQLRLQAAVDQMLSYALQHLPELARIEVALYDRYELGDEPGIAIDAYTRRPFDSGETADRDLDRWMAAAFPPETLEHVILSYRQGVPHAG